MRLRQSPPRAETQPSSATSGGQGNLRAHLDTRNPQRPSEIGCPAGSVDAAQAQSGGGALPACECPTENTDTGESYAETSEESQAHGSTPKAHGLVGDNWRRPP